MDFIIDRSKWRSAGDTNTRDYNGRGRTSLLNSEGFMCCLGHVSLQCGLTEQDIRCRLMPENVKTKYLLNIKKKNPDYINNDFCDTTFSKRAATINDTRMSDYERESRLKVEFETWGHTVIFIGAYVKETI